MEIVEPMSPESVKLEIQEHFICPLCQTSLDTPEELGEHFRAVHIELESHTCIICSQSFQSKIQLEQHHQKHRYIPHGVPNKKHASPIKRKVSLGGRACVKCHGEFQPESCLRHPLDAFVMCLLCYGRELEVHIGKVAASNGKINEEFEYAQLLAADSLRLADKRRIQVVQTRMSQVEIDARVKAINKEMAGGNSDKNKLIRNYGLTHADYERSSSETTTTSTTTQSLGTLIDHGIRCKITPKITTKKDKNGGDAPTVIRPDISKLYETYNLISPSVVASTNGKGNQLTQLQDGLYSSTQNSSRRGRVSRPKRENVCVNCGCKNATLWRKLKSADEIQAKKPELKVDRAKDHWAGQLACNPCALYWSMHGRHRLKEHTVDYVPLRRKSKNHSSHHSKQPAAKTNDTLTSNTTDLSLPTLVSTTTTNLTEALATLTEQLTANMNNKQQEAEMDKLLREINSPAKRRKTDPESGAVSSDSITSDESEPQLDPSAVAAYLETELLSLAHCDVCKAQPSSFDQVRTCFMCPSKFYCAGCLLSIPHLLQHSKLNNQLATNDT